MCVFALTDIYNKWLNIILDQKAKKLNDTHRFARKCMLCPTSHTSLSVLTCSILQCENANLPRTNISTVQCHILLWWTYRKGQHLTTEITFKIICQLSQWNEMNVQCAPCSIYNGIFLIVIFIYCIYIFCSVTHSISAISPFPSYHMAKIIEGEKCTSVLTQFMSRLSAPCRYLVVWTNSNWAAPVK